MRIRVFTHAHPLRLKLVPKRQIGGNRKENELELCIPSIRGVTISHNWKEESNADAPWHTQMWAVDAVSRRNNQAPDVCGVAGDVSAGSDKQESIAQDILKPPRDLALRLGLKPYAEFEKKMSPLFARITSDERQQFLRNIYRCAAEKVLMERTRAANRESCPGIRAGGRKNAAGHLGYRDRLAKPKEGRRCSGSRICGTKPLSN